MEHEGFSLTTLGDKLLPSPIKNDLLALCPEMDLIALVNQENQIQIFRMNGELVHGIPRKRPESNATQLAWRPDGALLGIGYADGSVQQFNALTGTIAVHRTSLEADAGIYFLGWGLNMIDPASIKRKVEPPLREELAQVPDHLSGTSSQGNALDVAEGLTRMEVEEFLLKLSPLPALNQKHVEESFSSKASLRAIFHDSTAQEQQSIDVLVAAQGNGSMSIDVDGSFNLTQWRLRKPNHLVQHYASHIYSSTHVITCGQQDLKHGPIHMHTIDLSPVADPGRYLPLVASKTRQMSQMLSYLDLAQRQIITEFQNSQDLPKKFMRNIEESLQEKDHCSFVDAAYHLAATGHAGETMKEWLTDELAERGHKRWDKATTSGYENVRRYTHENLLPALQRFSVVLSRLRGLSKFQDSSPALGVESQEIDQAFDTLNCLELLAHCILLYVNQELKQFNTFSTWLKHEIEFQGIDPTSSAYNEVMEKDVIPDYAHILDYINGAMLKSQLYKFLDLETGSTIEDWGSEKEGMGFYERYKIEVKKIRSGERPEQKLPGLQTLLARLQEQCRTIFRKMMDSQARKVRLGEEVLLGHDVEGADLTMLPVDHSPTTEQMYVYFVQIQNTNHHPLSITRFTLNISNGISTVEDRRVATITLSTGIEIQDIKFVDSEDLVILFSLEAESSIFYMKYQSDWDEDMQSDGRPSLTYHPVGSKEASEAAKADHLPTQAFLKVVQHTFPSADHPWRPNRVHVNGRRGRRVLCAIAEDQTRYALFDYDSWQSREVIADESEDNQDDDDNDGDEQMLMDETD